MRRFIVDTIAIIIFFTSIAALTELFVAGMTPSEVLKTCLIMIPMMVITGPPYGVWRDWFFNKTKPTVSWSKTLIDGLTFLSLASNLRVDTCHRWCRSERGDNHCHFYKLPDVHC
jgi:hypothetical protein